MTESDLILEMKSLHSILEGDFPKFFYSPEVVGSGKNRAYAQDAEDSRAARDTEVGSQRGSLTSSRTPASVALGFTL